MAGVTALPGASRRPEPGRVSKHSISGLEYHSWDQAFSRGSEEQECLKRVSEGKSDMFGDRQVGVQGPDSTGLCESWSDTFFP